MAALRFRDPGRVAITSFNNSDYIRICKFPLIVAPGLDPVGVNVSRRGVGKVTLFAGDVPCDKFLVRVGTLITGLMCGRA